MKDIKKRKNRKQVEIITKSDRETKKLGALLAKTIFTIEQHLMLLKLLNELAEALVISLEGDLGSGKTTFAKGFAKGLGIRETIQSPTFVIAKIYQIKKQKWTKRKNNYQKFIHIDAYRITAKDLPAIGWNEFIKNPQNIILIEWGERVRAALPKNHIKVLFQHRAPQKRFIRFLVS